MKLLLKVRKTKEMMDFERNQDRNNHPLWIFAASIERVESFKYLGGSYFRRPSMPMSIPPQTSE